MKIYKMGLQIKRIYEISSKSNNGKVVKYPRETFGIDFYTFIKIWFIFPVLDVSTCNWIENKFRHVLTRVPRYSSVPAQLSIVAPDVVVARRVTGKFWASQF